MQQGSLQIYLKSENGPIEVYLCPEEGLEDASPVKSSLTPKGEFQQPLRPTATASTTPSSCSIKEEATERMPLDNSLAHCKKIVQIFFYVLTQCFYLFIIIFIFIKFNLQNTASRCSNISPVPSLQPL